MNRWLRVVLPSWQTVFMLTILLQLLVMLPDFYSLWRFSHFRRLGLEPPVEFYKLAAHMPMIVAVIYGAYRAVAFNPAVRPEYRRWLERTPWTSDRPLPLGPITLVAQDFVILVGLMLLAACPSMAFHDQLIIERVVEGFFGGYLLFGGAVLASKKETHFAFVIGIGLGAILRTSQSPIVCGTTCFLTYAVMALGIRQSLRRFPWTDPESDEPWMLKLPNDTGSSVASRFGWPMYALSAKWRPAESLRTGWDGFYLSLLLGWWWYASNWLITENAISSGRQLDLPTPMLMLVVGAAILMRLATYCVERWPPISLWGRIRSRRWIIPGYDKVLIAPLINLALVVGFGMWLKNITRTHSDPKHWIDLYVGPVFLTLNLLIAFCAPPSIRNFHLTGSYRLVYANKGPTSVKVG
ncbi:MAG: hypothetical protein NT013_17030 [Planctomycetia bacterium]|nr:hypothetical protein [Planctomycetia bacterium]